MSYARLEGRGCSGLSFRGSPGTPFLHKDGKFTRGKGLFSAIEFRARELPDEEYPLILTTGRNLYHYHTGTMTRRSVALDKHVPEAELEINPQLAAKMGIQDGERSDCPPAVEAWRLRPKLPTSWQRTWSLTFHFHEAAVNWLTNADSLDPVAKIPEYKVCALDDKI